jgi:hypothetical protein
MHQHNDWESSSPEHSNSELINLGEKQ